MTWFASVLLIALVPTSLHADSHKDAIRKLFVVMEMEKTYQETVKSSLEVFDDTVFAEVPVAKRSKIRKFFLDTLAWKEIEGDVVMIYRNAFSESEINEMTKFYSTATGRKALRVMPQMQQQLSAIGQIKVQANAGKLRDLLDDAAGRSPDRKPASVESPSNVEE